MTYTETQLHFAFYEDIEQHITEFWLDCTTQLKQLAHTVLPMKPPEDVIMKNSFDYLLLQKALRKRATAYRAELATYDHADNKLTDFNEGVVVFYSGELCGWVNELRNPESWKPGCIAIDNQGNLWKSTGYNREWDGANQWTPIVKQ